MVNNKNRGNFSNRGFLLAASGSAFSLSNIWRFPYLVGENGGGAFLLIYILLTILIGFSLILGEMTLGRWAGSNPIDAYRRLGENWKYAGVLGTVTSFLLATYYAVVGGWILKYIFAYIMGNSRDLALNSESVFVDFVSSDIEQLLWVGIFIVVSLFIVSKGIEKGIERANKIIIPGIFILLILLGIRSLTLPGSIEGLKFYLTPDFSSINVLQVVRAALGQVFFSLGLGAGVVITLGSYLNKSSDLVKNSAIIPTIDIIASFIVGLVIIPAVFAFGFEVEGGPGLIFVTLPAVFNSMTFGNIFALVFFILVFLTTITSSIAFLETSVSYLIDNKSFPRKKAIIVIGMIAFIFAIPQSLSFGSKRMLIGGENLFELVGKITEGLLMPMGGILLCIFIGYIWKPDNAIKEITQGDIFTFKSQKYWKIMVKYIIPLSIVLIIIQYIVK